MFEHFDDMLLLKHAGLADDDGGGALHCDVGVVSGGEGSFAAEVALKMLLVLDVVASVQIGEFVVAVDELLLAGFHVVEETSKSLVVGFGF